jgi:hypothetical protein
MTMALIYCVVALIFSTAEAHIVSTQGSSLAIARFDPIALNWICCVLGCTVVSNCYKMMNNASSIEG